MKSSLDGIISITCDTVNEHLRALSQPTADFGIVTSNSAYCLICHTDLSGNKARAPKGLVSHLVRSKKCRQQRARSGFQVFGLKRRECPDLPVAQLHNILNVPTDNSKRWESADRIFNANPSLQMYRNIWKARSFPAVSCHTLLPISLVLTHSTLLDLPITLLSVQAVCVVSSIIV